MKSRTQLDLILQEIPAEEGVYLLHFDQPISMWHPTQHYIGYSSDLRYRLTVELIGGSNAARLCQVAREKGIQALIARIWTGVGRDFEKSLKQRKEAHVFCPLCKGQVRWKQSILPGFRAVPRKDEVNNPI